MVEHYEEGPMKIVRSADPHLFFSSKEKQKIIQAIQEAERQTSAEIRVHLERQARSDFLEHGREIFKKIGMAQTLSRNGVLFLLGVKSRRFAVLGDAGIHEKVPAGFWDGVVREMAEYFKQDRFADGFAEGIRFVGQTLKKEYPRQPGDINELPDEISYSL